MKSKPRAVFMAFGTKGDVYPVAAIAAAFASDQEQYQVVFITHSAHENLRVHLRANQVMYIPVSSPPAVSPLEHYGSTEVTFSAHKREITQNHRHECTLIFEDIFGDVPNVEGDLIAINFFALEGWSLAELFQIRCIVVAPYVVPYSAPSSFERQFRKELPDLYKYLQEAPSHKVGWKDVIHWMWPLFAEEWGSWRSLDLKLSAFPFTDPVTGLPTFHERLPSPLLLKTAIALSDIRIFSSNMHYPGACITFCKEELLSDIQWLDDRYGFSKEIVEYPGNLNQQNKLCSAHLGLQFFIEFPAKELPVFIGLSSVGSMGFLRNPRAFLRVLGTALDISGCRFILFSAGYKPLEAAIESYAKEASSCSEQTHWSNEGVSLFGGRLFCFSGSVPYNWLFPRCAAAIHHGGSGSTAAALQAGVPQVICPFMLDQFYWAERMCWLGVAPEPLRREHLVPDTDEDFYIKEAANMLVRALDHARSSEVKARALQISNKLSNEDGVSEAVRVIKEELRSCQ
ncbi:sterol 3-beta-glucosyltransferase isoform X2 [Nicotiana sylvestris]|uniref:Sterol 3-beta-glucosyltransferase isoform X4 n=1 Tax=Nicotiana sylvestris TaxID=4096 RepID=A0A1U7WNG7_NICSY|nr:PREDICTED: sterol 3-beta-glucosyltransferase isoform X4 [Nicotiana sylvestris]XP_016434426.1 PREDICTED: sterol 3-beta-glucosyltransferase isoform X2 [Nicotiana tabacum]